MLIAITPSRNRPIQADEIEKLLPDVWEREEEEPPRPAASFPKSNAMLLAVAALLPVAVVPRRSVSRDLFILLIPVMTVQ